MPKKRTEETKRHGDPMEPLIDRTGGGAPDQANVDDEPADRESERSNERD